MDRIKEILKTGILTGETEYVDNAKDVAQRINVTYDQIMELEPYRKQDVADIKALFNEYFELTQEITNEMISGDFDMDSLMQRAAAKEEKLTLLIEKTQAFADYAHSNFSASIATANENSKNMLTSGFIIWSVCILLMGVTVITVARLILNNINQISKSLAEIAKGESDFASSIAVNSHDEIGRLANSFNALMDNLKIKTNDLMCMMQHMHTGLFTVTEDEAIHREYSTRIESIFETDKVEGENYFDFLFAHAELGSDVKDQVKAAVTSLLGSDEMMFEFNSHLLIGEFTAVFDDGIGNKKTKYIEVDWDAIVNNEVITRIMVTVRDVTEIRAMQAEAASQKMELEIVGQILKLTPARFKDFARDADELLIKNHEIISCHSTCDLENVAQLFANMHTIKGNARTYQLTYVTDIVHEAEMTYDEIRKKDQGSWPKERMLDELLSVQEALMCYKNVLDEKLSFTQANQPDLSSGLLLEREQYEEMIQQLDTLSNTALPSSDFAELVAKFKKLDAVDLQTALGGLVSSLSDVAKQLEKEPPAIMFMGEEVFLKRQQVSTIVNVFSHVLKNSIDHGLELPADRLESGKTPEGNIQIKSYLEDGRCVVEVSDDGRGLNIRRLCEKVSEKTTANSGDLSPQSVADSIFESGMSTAEVLTDISGRGVGMDAVKKYLNGSGCDIAIKLKSDASFDHEYEPFKLVLTLGNEVCLLPASTRSDSHQANG